MTLLPTTNTRTVLDKMPIWMEEFNALTHRIAAYFARLEVRHRAAAYLKCLLSPIERKNSWQLAEQAGDTTPYGIQHLLRRAQWDPNAVRDVLRAYVVEPLADPKAVVVVDETGFLKKGDKSVGVQRQYSGTAGRVENCQIGVFLVYASSKGHSFIDRELYLPQSWTQDKAKCQEAGVADDIAFATKPQLAKQMLARAFASEVPVGWVSGDSVYGDHRLRRWLEEQQQPYVLGVTSQQALWWQHRAQVLVSELPATAWQCLSAGEGTKGPRCYEWVMIELNTPLGPQWQKRLLVKRSLSDPQELAYYSVFAPAGTSMAEVVRVAGARWTIEQCFQTAKEEVGLDQYEVRTWQGWYRHITLSLLAHAFLTIVRAAASEVKTGGIKEQRQLVRVKTQTKPLLPLTLPEIRRLLGTLLWESPLSVDHQLHWSYWRRWHQTVAKHYHYKRRLARLPVFLPL